MCTPRAQRGAQSIAFAGRVYSFKQSTTLKPFIICEGYVLGSCYEPCRLAFAEGNPRFWADVALESFLAGGLLS